MKDEILSYRNMCDQEGVQTLQKGMNYRLNANYTVILMSQRPNAPYKDKIYEDGLTIEYEGHDIPRSYSRGIKLTKISFLKQVYLHSVCFRFVFVIIRS